MGVEKREQQTVRESISFGLKGKLDDFNTAAEREGGWRMDVISKPTTPILKRGFEYLDQKQDLLLALCLNNGYYNRENVHHMLEFALAFSDSVQVFTTDGPAKHNYRAFGRPETEVVRKTRLERNHLQNLTKDALKLINVNLPPDKQKTVTFLDWDAIYADPNYQTSVEGLKKLYESNEQFKNDINEITAKVLLGRVGINKDTEAILSEGIQYVLEEVALIIAYRQLGTAAKPIAEHGTNGFNYIYYEPWPVFEKLANGEYGTGSKDDIGFLIAKVEPTK